MQMSPEVTQALSQVKPGGAAGVPAQPPNPGPAAGGMLTPQRPSGEMQAGRTKVLVAMKMLEQALASFGAIGKEGDTVLKAISSLAKTFGKQEGDASQLMDSERKTIAGGLPAGGAGGAPPMGGSMPGAAPQPSM